MVTNKYETINKHFAWRNFRGSKEKIIQLTLYILENQFKRIVIKDEKTFMVKMVVVKQLFRHRNTYNEMRYKNTPFQEYEEYVNILK